MHSEMSFVIKEDPSQSNTITSFDSKKTGRKNIKKISKKYLALIWLKDLNQHRNREDDSFLHTI